jgi:hypothetical protein
MDSHRAAKLRPRGVVLRRFARPALVAAFGVAWNPQRHSPLLDSFIACCRTYASPAS